MIRIMAHGCKVKGFSQSRSTGFFALAAGRRAWRRRVRDSPFQLFVCLLLLLRITKVCFHFEPFLALGGGSALLPPPGLHMLFSPSVLADGTGYAHRANHGMEVRGLAKREYVEHVPPAQSRAAESSSMSRVACDCLRRMEAGQAVLMGPRKAALTAMALRFSGATQIIRLAEQSAGMVREKA